MYSSIIFNILKDERNLIDFCKIIKYDDFNINYSLTKDLDSNINMIEIYKFSTSGRWSERIFHITIYEDSVLLSKIDNKEILNFIKYKIRGQKLKRLINCSSKINKNNEN